MKNKRKNPPKIIEFRREDASKLAELFNSFDEEGLWPGGFTGGVPYTAERVLDSFPIGVRSICILIATHKDKFTGICTVHPHYEDAEAAYVGVLGVHPKYLGQGHGKALLLKALQEASKRNLRRVDLNTWAGNLRAVPLYKKCGMFWVPETSVAMEDYIPGILSLPYAQEFFKKHDWYTSQKRTLQLTPDAFKVGEMEVYPYEFSEGNDHLTVWVDRYGKGISGIEQTVEGRHLRIACKLENHKVITGLPQVLTIEIQNDSNTLLDGSMFLTAFEGLRFTTSTQQAFRVQHNTSTTLTAQFTVNADIDVPEISRKQKSIQVNLIVNGKLFPLEVGLRILPLLTFTTHPENITVA
ncbi:MAG: GNAT family N-acetyltransferase, partial [Candidatus Bathyarchaeota archaeon]